MQQRCCQVTTKVVHQQLKMSGNIKKSCSVTTKVVQLQQNLSSYNKNCSETTKIVQEQEFFSFQFTTDIVVLQQLVLFSNNMAVLEQHACWPTTRSSQKELFLNNYF